MQIVISYESGEPIYEQIKKQIRSMIVCGNLVEGAALPSIRTLAKELNIGIITAKRAYDDLSAEGFLYSVQGKGVFVATFDKARAQEYAENAIRSRIKDTLLFASRNSVTLERAKTIIKEEIGE